MKKFLIISGGLALFFFVGMFCICWLAIDALTLEKGRNKTSAAREKRWMRNGTSEDPKSEDPNEIEEDENHKVNPDEKAQ